MGNHRFRFSDMLPNAWFYKLKDMGKPGRNPGIPHTLKKNHTPRTSSSATKPFSPPQPPPPKQPYHPGRASYYFPSRDETDRLPNSPIHPRASDTLFPADPPRKSSKKARRRTLRPSTRLVVTSSVSSGCSCRAASPGSVVTSEATPEFSVSSESSPGENGLSSAADNFEFGGNGRLLNSSPTDIIIDMPTKISSFTNSLVHNSEDLGSVSELVLPPILTKPAENSKLDHRNMKSEEKSHHKLDAGAPRRSFNSIQGIKVRANSPRLASKKIQACRNRKTTVGSPPPRKAALTESFAVVKSSSDPQRDFRDSMVEMIVENNIRSSRDLEELLACYLSLNSNEYHDLIVKVFEQIWFDLTDIRL